MTAQLPDQTQLHETQLEELPDDAQLSSPQPHVWARLVPLADPSVPFELVGEAVVVGRSREKGCDFVFSHPRISSRHCEIRLRGGQVILTDLSQNGTFVNSEKLAKDTPVVLRSGDQVSLLQPRSAAADLRLSAFYVLVRNDGRASGQDEPAGSGAGAAAGAPAANERRPAAVPQPNGVPLARAAPPAAGAGPQPLGPPLQPLGPPPPRPREPPTLVPSGPLESGEDLLRAYELREVLGQGSFAVVRRGVHRQSGEQFAIKVLAKKRLLGSRAAPSAEEKEKVLREAKILKRIKHDNVIKLYDVIETHDSLYLVMELVEGGELYDDLINHGAFPEPQARELTAQLLSALGYLHAQGIVHRDLKPENILLAYEADTAPAPSQPRAPNGSVPLLKLADFGLAKMIQGDCSAKTFCGTPQYFAPEVLESRDSSRGYGTACDMWSAGVILYILLSGQPPFEGEDVYAQVRKGHYALPHDRWHAISPAAKHMLSQMMMVDPQRRITVGAALRHPWMRCEDLSPAELAELEGPTAGGRGLGGLPASVVDGQHRALAVDDIEESWSEDEGQRALQQPNGKAVHTAAARPPRPKVPTASLATTIRAPVGAGAQQPASHAPALRGVAGSGLMAPSKPSGAADSALTAKRRKMAGGSSAANRLPFIAGPPLLAQGKPPLVSEPGLAPAAARRLGLPPTPPLPAAAGVNGGAAHGGPLDIISGPNS